MDEALLNLFTVVMKRSRHVLGNSVLSSAFVLRLLFVCLILSCARVIFRRIFSLILHWSLRAITIYIGCLLLAVKCLLLLTSGHLLLHCHHIDPSTRHHGLEWSHVEHWIGHESCWIYIVRWCCTRSICTSIRSHWPPNELSLLLEKAMFILSSRAISYLKHLISRSSRRGWLWLCLRWWCTHLLLMHLLQLQYLLLLHQHADLSVGSLVKLGELVSFAAISQLHDVLLDGELGGLLAALIVLD